MNEELENPMAMLVPFPMGRPPLGMKPTTVRLSLETIRRIQAQIGNRQLASFIREAVENELARREKGSR